MKFKKFYEKAKVRLFMNLMKSESENILIKGNKYKSHICI